MDNQNFDENNSIDDREIEQEKKQGKAYRSGLITGVIWGIAIVFALILGANILGAKLSNNSSGSVLNSSSLTGTSKSSLIKQYIDKYFYKEVDEDDLTEGMYAGMLESLGDKYSVYYTKEQYKAMSESSEGKYTGIGVVVSYNSDENIIIAAKIYDGSPAQKAGMQVGDIIYSVDDKVASEITYDELVAAVRGKEGSEVVVKVKRNDEIIEMSMTREAVEVEVVTYEMLENNIGYIVLDQFTESSINQFKNALDDLSSQGMKKVIVDVRDNPGGTLDSVKSILDYFLPPDKLLLYSKTKEGDVEKYFSDDEALIPDMPMCVLVNENSASASEVFSGTLKFYDRATIVGTTTFGKGIMQSIFSLGDGTALKLTIGKYYLPDDSNIHEIGITPDIDVEMPETVTNIWAIEHKDDPQICKAIEFLNEK